MQLSFATSLYFICDHYHYHKTHVYFLWNALHCQLISLPDLAFDICFIHSQDYTLHEDKDLVSFAFLPSI